MIAWENKLGVRNPDKAKLFVVLSPVGPYYPSGFKPIKLYTETKRIRAAPGGTGHLKVGGNYAPTIPLSHNVEKKGYH
jgi:branched-chain amino acid aminotransferase